MQELVLPKVEVAALAQNYGKFLIGPLETGYGTTVGIALRRVLISSLPGAAVTSVKVDGIHHEFSPIPHLQEDTMALILNVKQLRFRLHGDGPLRLSLSKRGPGSVTAADIELPSEVEVVNPELELATIDSERGKLEMELVVEKGRGYSPIEERGKLPIGELPVDAIFSPIRKVSYTLEAVRLGQRTNLDQLSMEIWTDGSIDPKEALSTAAQILMRHLAFIVDFGGLKVEGLPERKEAIPAQIYERPIEDLELTVRAFNSLKRAGITKVGEVLERLEKGDDEILAIRNFGQKSLVELKEALVEKGLWAPKEES
ncbi:MAG: DNA-directed RNA polymerase subunit alpha [Chloroflexi bacterium]|nr:DNA-directed RNA polymerase subunit alpha [Chloroflexota bacterium]